MKSNDEKLKSFWMGWSKTYRLKGHQLVEAESMKQAQEEIAKAKANAETNNENAEMELVKYI